MSGRRPHNPNPHHQHQRHAPFPSQPPPCTNPRACDKNHHNKFVTEMHHMRTFGVACPDHLWHIWIHNPGTDPHADSTVQMFEATGKSMDLHIHLGLLPPIGMFPTERWDGAPSRSGGGGRGGGMMGDDMGFGGMGGAREMESMDEHRHGFDGRRGGERDFRGVRGGRRPGGEPSEDGFGEDSFEGESSDDEDYGQRRGQRGGSRGPPKGGRNGRGRW